MSWNEILDTPVRDLFMLRDINDEIQLMKKKLLEEDPKSNGGEDPSGQPNEQH